MKIAKISSLTPPPPPLSFFTLYRGWKYKIPLRVAWPSCLRIRKICKLNSFQFLFVSLRSSCVQAETPSSSTCYFAYCKNIAYSISEETVQEERKRANSFPSLKIQRPKNSRFSFDFPPRTWRQQVFRIFPTIANTTRARDGIKWCA